jgi:hypothetical protein
MDDKVNIGLTNDANLVAERLELTGLFEDRLSVAKFAIAIAIKEGLDNKLEDYRQTDSMGTKWNIGSVDSDQYLRDLMISLYPECNTPYRYIEALMNRGLIFLGNIIKRKGTSKISELIKA